MNQTPSPSPTEPSWTSDYFREPAAAGVSPLGRGLVGHVGIVAVCLIVQGVLEVLFGGFMVLFGCLFLNNPQLQGMQTFAWFMIVIALPGFACGGLRIAAGVFNLRFRRRVLGMTALGAGLLTMITGYCAPTSIALAIYGLIVYLNDSTIAAFAMGDGGKEPADIQAAFPPTR
jgi:hypothetical protein